jgi:hypothetical protein
MGHFKRSSTKARLLPLQNDPFVYNSPRVKVRFLPVSADLLIGVFAFTDP